VNAAKDSASIGGSVGSMTGDGRSAYVLRVRVEVKFGSVGDACGERRRAKDEMGVNVDAGLTLSLSSEPPRARLAGRGGTGGIESLLVIDLRLLDEERLEETDADCGLRGREI
jgi:hypothetical protein